MCRINMTASNLRRDHPRMRAFSYACSLPVTWQRWQLHHWSAVPENPMLHANITALCLIKRELLPIEVLHCGNRNFRHFLLLWPWPWPDDLYIRTWLVVLRYMPHVQIWTSYVKAFESYRLTDVQTDTTKIIHHAVHEWSITVVMDRNKQDRKSSKLMAL